MLLAVSLVLVSGGLSACGNKGEKSAGTVKNAVQRNAESREDKAVNKALDAFSALKGAEIQDTVHVDTGEGGRKKSVTMDMSVEYQTKPFGSKAKVITTVNGEVSHSTVMADGKDMYLQLPTVYASGKTYRRTLKGQIGYNKFATDAANTAPKLLKAMKKNGAKITVKNEGGETVISCDASKKKLTDVQKTELLRITSPVENTYASYEKSELARWKFDECKLEVHIDSDSSQPKSYTANVTAVRTGTDGTKSTRTESFEARYLDVNNAGTVEMPKEYIDYDQNHTKK